MVYSPIIYGDNSELSHGITSGHDNHYGHQIIEVITAMIGFSMVSMLIMVSLVFYDSMVFIFFDFYGLCMTIK